MRCSSRSPPSTPKQLGKGPLSGPICSAGALLGDVAAVNGHDVKRQAKAGSACTAATCRVAQQGVATHRLQGIWRRLQCNCKGRQRHAPMPRLLLCWCRTHSVGQPSRSTARTQMQPSTTTSPAAPGAAALLPQPSCGVSPRQL
jgi:hypothetical protein